MFENLSERLQQVVKKLRGQARVNEEVLAETLREIRLALLEADVAVPVVRKFLEGVKAKALGLDVQGSLTPGQQVVKVVRDELVRMLGGEGAHDLAFGAAYPAVVMMVGLQGSGKTTTTSKIGRLLKARSKFPFLVPADIARPAAIAQLVRLAREGDLGVLDHDGQQPPLAVVKRGMIEARQKGYDVVLVDTAGRLHVDEALMAELQQLKSELRPSEILFVADAMTGQDAVRSAREFHEKLGLTGICLTKLDGDARGGAALSIADVTGVPLKFVGTGEKSDALEAFRPERMVSRILGMGDVLTLIEKAEEAFDVEEAERLEKKLRRDEFTLQDFSEQIGEDHQARPAGEPARDDPRRGRPQERADRPWGGPARAGDHLLDDAARAARPVGAQRKPQEAGRPGVGDQRAGDQPPAEAVHAGPQNDEEPRPRGRGGRGRPGMPFSFRARNVGGNLC